MIPYRIRPATEADSGGIRTLLARAYAAEFPEQEWFWKFSRNPDGWFGVVAESEQGQIVGNFAGWPMRFVLDRVERTVYSAGDVATIPEARGLGKSRNIYGEMAEAFYEAVRRQGVPFTFGFPHPRAHEISRRLGGTRDYFPVRQRAENGGRDSQRLSRCPGFRPAPLRIASGRFGLRAFLRLPVRRDPDSNLLRPIGVQSERAAGAEDLVVRVRRENENAPAGQLTRAVGNQRSFVAAHRVAGV